MVDVDVPKLWRKASGCESHACVEVGFHGEEVFVRNSRAPRGARVTFTIEEWRVFCAAVEAGELRV